MGGIDGINHSVKGVTSFENNAVVERTNIFTDNSSLMQAIHISFSCRFPFVPSLFPH